MAHGGKKRTRGANIARSIAAGLGGVAQTLLAKEEKRRRDLEEGRATAEETRRQGEYETGQALGQQRLKAGEFGLKESELAWQDAQLDRDPYLQGRLANFYGSALPEGTLGTPQAIPHIQAAREAFFKGRLSEKDLAEIDLTRARTDAQKALADKYKRDATGVGSGGGTSAAIQKRNAIFAGWLGGDRGFKGGSGFQASWETFKELADTKNLDPGSPEFANQFFKALQEKMLDQGGNIPEIGALEQQELAALTMQAVIENSEAFTGMFDDRVRKTFADFLVGWARRNMGPEGGMPPEDDSLSIRETPDEAAALMGEWDEYIRKEGRRR